MAKFKGFNNQQLHQLLSEHGYTGPAQKDDMDAFVASSPAAASMLGRYNEMARERIEGKPMGMGMSEGGVIPDWVDGAYSYDPANPRKPTSAELKAALAGVKPKDNPDYRNDPAYKAQPLNAASDLLYGVVGANTDTRDWQAIMSSDNILSAAQQATGQMYSSPKATANTITRSTTDSELQGKSNKTEYARVEGSFDKPSIVETPSGFAIVAANGLVLRGGFSTKEQAEKQGSNFGIGATATTSTGTGITLSLIHI